MKEFKLFDLDETVTEKISDKSKGGNTKQIYNPIAVQKEAEVNQIKAWALYQEAIVKSSALTNEITKGIQAEENPVVLLLKAVECISLITGNELFYELNKKNIKNIYSVDLKE
jgi:hypothetical protein